MAAPSRPSCPQCRPHPTSRSCADNTPHAGNPPKASRIKGVPLFLYPVGKGWVSGLCVPKVCWKKPQIEGIFMCCPYFSRCFCFKESFDFCFHLIFQKKKNMYLQKTAKPLRFSSFRAFRAFCSRIYKGIWEYQRSSRLTPLNNWYLPNSMSIKTQQ